jgi:hypothetical protein
MSQQTKTSAGTAQTAEREFDIGDVVSLATEDVLATVTGVIHDSGRLFITAPGDAKEREVPFSAVGEQYVLKSASAAQQLREQRDELLAALQVLVSRIDYYTKLGADAAPNIEQWEYTAGSSDMAQARAAIARATGGEAA